MKAFVKKSCLSLILDLDHVRTNKKSLHYPLGPRNN